jgi:thymidylate synthase
MSETAEHQYIDYVKHILDCGELKTNRTGIATKSIFGGTMR